jgi:hypothetical protein
LRFFLAELHFCADSRPFCDDLRAWGDDLKAWGADWNPFCDDLNPLGCRPQMRSVAEPQPKPL